ncbi:MAG: 16S rRNA (cytidine(1402)-2'-O)-methyltransferase [Cyanobacteria bacterium P01_A01_bin.135]
MSQPSVSPSELVSDRPLVPGTLYVVGTPIGNLEDMTFRAVRVLQQADVVAAEDTRRTGRLLQHFQITTPQISYHQHNHRQRAPELLQRLQAGQAIALVTDAGMPGISDPGGALVRACRDAGLPVSPIPGASAGVTALSAAGLATERFTFEGFLPSKGRDRQQRLEALKAESRTAILYEAPHRLQPTLADLTAMLGGERQVVIARELTKRYEEFWEGSLGAATERYRERNPQGEFTLLLAGVVAAPLQLSDDAIRAELQRLLTQGLSHTAASRQLAQQADLPRRRVYQLALSLKEE